MCDNQSLSRLHWRNSFRNVQFPPKRLSNIGNSISALTHFPIFLAQWPGYALPCLACRAAGFFTRAPVLLADEMQLQIHQPTHIQAPHDTLAIVYLTTNIIHQGVSLPILIVKVSVRCKLHWHMQPARRHRPYHSCYQHKMHLKDEHTRGQQLIGAPLCGPAYSGASWRCATNVLLVVIISGSSGHTVTCPTSRSEAFALPCLGGFCYYTELTRTQSDTKVSSGRRSGLCTTNTLTNL